VDYITALESIQPTCRKGGEKGMLRGACREVGLPITSLGEGFPSLFLKGEGGGGS